MASKYRNARIKKLKIYTENEINNCQSEMEKSRLRFWNDKAEELATSNRTANESKLTLMGIIDVDWTMRKTSLIQEEAKALADAQNLIRKPDDQVPQLKKGKRDTIPKNLDRMAAAHAATESYDREMKKIKDIFKKSSRKEKEKMQKEYERQETRLNGAYSELKRAQDATLKSIRGKRKVIDEYLTSISPQEEGQKHDLQEGD